LSEPRDHTFRCPRCGKALSYDAAMGLLWCPDPDCATVVPRPGGAPADSGLHPETSLYRSVQRPGRWPVEDGPEWPEEKQGRGRRVVLFLGALVTAVAVLAMALSPLLWPKRPVISLSPGIVSFNDFSGEGALPQAFAIQNDGKGTLEWNIEIDAHWLWAEPSSGTLDDGVQVVVLQADIAGMAPGTYDAVCTVNGVRAYNTPQDLKVVLELRNSPEARAMQEDLGGNAELFYDTQPPYVSGPTGVMIQLVNNDAATDVSWDYLMQFVLEDYTDESPYIEDLQMCGSFAETLHNNAEAAGIRAAWVSIELEGQEIGHALNAFVTSDRGLVFIDCTGEDSSSLVVAGVEPGSCDYDKVAYVQVGEPYGLVSVRYAKLPSYLFFSEYSAAWERYMDDLNRYNALVDEYNSLVGGRTLVAGSPEAGAARRLYGEIQVLRVDLEVQQELLGQCQWNSLGIVKRVEIYW